MGILTDSPIVSFFMLIYWKRNLMKINILNVIESVLNKTRTVRKIGGQN